MAGTAPPPSRAPWSHSWDTAGEAWWGDFGYSLLNHEQATFVAAHYKVASLEKCTGKAQNMTTEAAIYQTAAQLKAINPKIKVMFYWHAGQAGIGCFANDAVFKAHPEWHLKDDYGNVVGCVETAVKCSPMIDWTIKAAADWWISVPLSGVHGDVLIDGVLADGSAFLLVPNISSVRLETLYDAGRNPPRSNRESARGH